MLNSNDLGRGPNGPYSDGIWFNVTWAFTEPPPAGALIGFEVALYTGVDATDTQNYVNPLVRVHANDRRARILSTIPRGTSVSNVNAAVRPLFGYGPGAWIAAGASTTPAPTGLEITTTDNLIPNPTSELGQSLTSYGSAAVYNDAVNSYVGSWCRRLDASATNETALTGFIPVTYGDQYSMSAYMKVSALGAGAQIGLKFYDSTGAIVGNSNSSQQSAVSYGFFGCQGAVPATAVSVRAFIRVSATSAGKYAYFDNLSLRRSINFQHLTTDAGFRTLNALKNTGSTTSDRTWYAGNNDTGTRGGAPNISCLTVKPQVWDTTTHVLHVDLALQPTAATDNLDGMRMAKVQLYKQSAAGTSGTLTAVGSPFFVPMTDRLFQSTTDSNTANAGTSSGVYVNAGINGGVPAALVTIYNAFGPSDTHCFYAASGWAAGTALTDNGTSFPAGLTGGSSGGTGGGSGGGGSCAEENVLVDVIQADGSVGQKRAGDVQPGDLVYTVDPNTGTVGRWPVLAASTAPGTKLYKVTIEENPDLHLVFQVGHRFRVQDQGWVEVEDLQPGMFIIGTSGGTVASVQDGGTGNVVAISVDMVHSYQTSGLLSSNVKILSP